MSYRPLAREARLKKGSQRQARALQDLSQYSDSAQPPSPRGGRNTAESAGNTESSTSALSNPPRGASFSAAKYRARRPRKAAAARGLTVAFPAASPHADAAATHFLDPAPLGWDPRAAAPGRAPRGQGARRARRLASRVNFFRSGRIFLDRLIVQIDRRFECSHQAPDFMWDVRCLA